MRARIFSKLLHISKIRINLLIGSQIMLIWVEIKFGTIKIHEIILKQFDKMSIFLSPPKY